jgi:hypothetical protein
VASFFHCDTRDDTRVKRVEEEVEGEDMDNQERVSGERRSYLRKVERTLGQLRGSACGIKEDMSQEE